MGYINRSLEWQTADLRFDRVRRTPRKMRPAIGTPGYTARPMSQFPMRLLSMTIRDLSAPWAPVPALPSTLMTARSTTRQIGHI